MTGARPADVTVRLLDGCRLEFGSPTAGAFTVALGTADRIAMARRELDAGLVQVRDKVRGLTVDPGDRADVAEALAAAGRRVMMVLFGLQAGVITGLQDFWARAVPFTAGRVPLVECVGDEEGILPLEYLPLFRADGYRSFVGFSCAVRRSILPLPQQQNTRLGTPGGRVHLRYMHYEPLRGARAEYAWLSTHATGHVQIEGPYPVAEGEAPTLVDQIFDPTVLLAGGHRAAPDHVLHFACHCFASERVLPTGYRIDLSGAGRRVTMTLGEIGDGIMERVLGGATRNGDRPLVVLNACGSSRMDAASRLSFPWLFLENGNRGFVGTDVEMRDEVAAEFCTAFYERFLIRGHPLAESLHGARTHLLHNHHNPLGLTYTAYADPDLHIP